MKSLSDLQNKNVEIKQRKNLYNTVYKASSKDIEKSANLGQSFVWTQMGISYQIIRYQHSKAALSITRPYCGCTPGMKENFTPRGGGLGSPQRATVLAAQASEPKFKVPEATGKLLWPLMLGPPAFQKAETGGLIIGLAGCSPFSLRVLVWREKGRQQDTQHPCRTLCMHHAHTCPQARI